MSDYLVSGLLDEGVITEDTAKSVLVNYSRCSEQRLLQYPDIEDILDEIESWQQHGGSAEWSAFLFLLIIILNNQK